MNKLIIALLVISILGNVVGLYFAYRYMKISRQMPALQESLSSAGKVVGDLTDKLESGYDKRMIFLHHSVGKGILYQGGLRDSLLNMGIFVKGATYGDEIGQRTDICDWVPKFTGDFKRILEFKNHPNQYYKDGRTNDIVMFKSCFPNSHVASEGAVSGDPSSKEKSMGNYKATFESLAKEFRKYPDKLFVYLTYPPLAPTQTNAEAAARAREFNTWLLGDYLPRYQKESGLHNFVIFDLFDVLADSDNVLRKEYRKADPNDSHPNDVANEEAARQFLEFFHPVWSEWENRASERAQSSQSKVSS